MSRNQRSLPEGQSMAIVESNVDEPRLFSTSLVPSTTDVSILRESRTQDRRERRRRRAAAAMNAPPFQEEIVAVTGDPEDPAPGFVPAASLWWCSIFNMMLIIALVFAVIEMFHCKDRVGSCSNVLEQCQAFIGQL